MSPLFMRERTNSRGASTGGGPVAEAAAAATIASTGSPSTSMAALKNKHLEVVVSQELPRMGSRGDSFHSHCASQDGSLADSDFAPGKVLRVWSNSTFVDGAAGGLESPPLSPERAVTAVTLPRADSDRDSAQTTPVAACVSTMASQTTMRSLGAAPGSRRSALQPQAQQQETPSTSGTDPAGEGWYARITHLLNYGHLSDAIRLPAPTGHLVRCYIKKAKGKLGSSPSFQLFMESNDQLLLVARRQAMSSSPVYVIGATLECLRKESDCVAKLKSNFVGTEFVLCGREEGRQEELCVHFRANGITAGPRTMTAALPSPGGAWSPSGDGGLAAALTQAKDRALPSHLERELSIVCTKPPEFDEATQCFTLAFRNRTPLVSKKNCQLVGWDQRTDRIGCEVLLQLVKLSDDTYGLDFAYPMSIHSAFAIALANLDDKLCHKI